jgi:hypothetical protein
LLQKYFNDESSFFIFSSEFCILNEEIKNKFKTKYGETIRDLFYSEEFIQVVIIVVYLFSSFFNFCMLFFSPKKENQKTLENIDLEKCYNFNVFRILSQVSQFNLNNFHF